MRYYHTLDRMLQWATSSGGFKFSFSVSAWISSEMLASLPPPSNQNSLCSSAKFLHVWEKTVDFFLLLSNIKLNPVKL